MKIKYLSAVCIVFLCIACKTNRQTAAQQPKEQITQESLKLDAMFIDAVSLKETGNFSKSEMLLNLILEKDSLYAPAMYEKSSIEFAKYNIDNAIKLCNKAIKLSPNNKWYSFQLINIYLAVNEKNNAKRTWQNLLKANPNDERLKQEYENFMQYLD